MPRRSPYQVVLSAEERSRLEAMSRRYTAPYRDVLRAKIVLLAAEGWENKSIAERLDTPRQIVRKWRQRFVEEGLLGLEERPRRGRPRVFPPTSDL